MPQIEQITFGVLIFWVWALYIVQYTLFSTMYMAQLINYIKLLNYRGFYMLFSTNCLNIINKSIFRFSLIN